jgi:hypothetical protein
MEYRVLLSPFSNQLSRAFSLLFAAASRQAKQAWVCAGRPACLPPSLPACMPACLPAAFFIYVLFLSVSAEEGSLQKCAAHFCAAEDVGLRAFLAGGSYLQEKYVRILHTSNTPYMY